MQKAIKREKKIRIIGDYDIDGIQATYILHQGLLRLGAIVDYAIPDRIEDGYGVNIRLMEKCVADGIGLVITCDNGIAAADAIAYAKEAGIEVIVTDHHEVPYEMVERQKKSIICRRRMPWSIPSGRTACIRVKSCVERSWHGK